MSEIVNLFVDGKITTRDDLRHYLTAEQLTTTEEIADTVTRLLPPAQAEPILQLLKEKD